MENRSYTLGHSLSASCETMPKTPDQISEFGARLSAFRKAAGYTQVELAEALGTTQRMITYYETRAEKAPAALLPKLAEVLGVSADALLGIQPTRKSKAPDTRFQRRLQQIEKMPASEKRHILHMLDTFIEHARLKQQADSSR
jgi:transcriptional regulator with XRE-family HTH domain